MTTHLKDIETLHAAIDNLSEGRNLSKVKIEAVLATLKRAEGIIFPSPDELLNYYVGSIELDCLNRERFPKVYRDLEESLIVFEQKFQIEINKKIGG